jgi:phasin
MAEKRGGASDAGAAGASGGAGQGAAGGAGTGPGVPPQVREMAEKSLGQAKQAVDQYMREATRLYGAMDSSMQAAQAGARDVSQKAVGFAEANISAAFDFAQQLVRTQNPQEFLSLQQKFLQQQIERMNSQMQEIGGVAKRTTEAATSAARPKT